jgi:16S rRNA C967 or C1407 C5-methylase (RsmB/RsmF family)
MSDDREERIKKHEEFKNKISQMLKDSGLKEVPKEESEASSEYTMSFSNNNPLSKLRVNRLTLSKEEVAWLKDRMEEPAKDIPQLRDLMNRKSVFEDDLEDKTSS